MLGVSDCERSLPFWAGGLVVVLPLFPVLAFCAIAMPALKAPTPKAQAPKVRVAQLASIVKRRTTLIDSCGAGFASLDAPYDDAKMQQ
jgi:hypothetical protein